MGSDVKNNSKVILKQIKGMLRRGELNEVHAKLSEIMNNDPHNHEALKIYKKLTEKKVSSFSKNQNLTQAKQLLSLFDQGNHEQVIIQATNLLRSHPKSSWLYNLLGLSLKNIGDLQRAEKLFTLASQLDKDDYNAHFNLGNCLSAQNKFSDAISAYSRAIEIDPLNYGAYQNMGNAHFRRSEMNEACDAYLKAVEINSTLPEIHYNLGLIYRDTNRFHNAIESFNTAIELRPSYGSALAALYYVKRTICDWSDTEELSSKLDQLGIGGDVASPFSLLTTHDSPELQSKRAQSWARKNFPNNNKITLPRISKIPDRIRVGYFGSDFHDHATLHLISGLLREHDKSKFEVHVYSYGNTKNSTLRNELMSNVEFFHDVAEYSDAEICNFARSNNIHIALDLKGYTQGARTRIFSERVAPIQINFLGFPGTMGAEFIEYIVADRTLIPPEFRNHYTESVIYMPDTYQPNDCLRLIDKRPMTRKEFGLPEHAFVMCCFNNNYKIGPREAAIWTELLHTIDKSILWLLGSNEEAQKNLLAHFERAGVSNDRVIFRKPLPHSLHLASMSLADIFLDTFAVNAHTSCSDALWAGIPVVTKLGNQFAARVASSLLAALELDELIAKDEEEYLKIVISLSQDIAKISSLKARVKTNAAHKALFDTAKFTNYLEKAFGRLLTDHVHERPSPDLYVANLR